MRISKERALELGLITCADDCINCEFCTDCHNTDSVEAINIALKTGYECPSLDEERVRLEMTEAEYDAWRHGRLEWAEEKTTSSNIRYVVINTYDREIMKVGVSKTPSEATEIMKADFMKVFLEYYNEKAFENEVGCGDEWEFNQTEAWLNTSSYDYDWRIIEVSDDDLL